jgi:hypothetical protein
MAIYYMGKTAMIDWSKMNQLWNEFEAKTIGKDIFPVYSLKVIKDKPDGSTEEIKLKGGYKTNDDKIKVKVESDFVPKLLVYDAHNPYLGAQIGKVEGKGGTVEIALKQGTNRIGFYVEGKKGGEWHWAGFDWINVVYEEKEEVEPADEYDLPVAQCDASKDLELIPTRVCSTNRRCKSNLTYKNTGTDAMVICIKSNRNLFSGWWSSPQYELDPGEEYEKVLMSWDSTYSYMSGKWSKSTSMFLVNESIVAFYKNGRKRCGWIGKYLEQNDEPPQGLTIINVDLRELDPCKEWSPQGAPPL